MNYLTVLTLALYWTLPALSHPNPGHGDHYGSFFYKGYDLSSLKIEEDGGAIYKDAQHGTVTNPVEQILEGMNTVRLRLWVHPVVPYDDGYYETYNLEYVMALAKRFYSQGFHIYLDYRESNLEID